MSNVKSKLSLLAIMLAFSIASGLLLEGLLGKWVHDRYWSGTIYKVDTSTAELADAFLETKALRDAITEEGPSDALRLAARHLVVERRRGEEVIWRLGNHHEAELLSDIRTRPLDDGSTLAFRRRTPPSWYFNLGQWIRRPGEWMTDRFDFITVPFIFFSLLSLLSCVAFVWRHRARYVENEVKEMIADLGRVDR